MHIEGTSLGELWTNLAHTPPRQMFSLSLAVGL
jgi:hypothetical protein